MIKKIVIAIVCLAVNSLYAQDGTISPYSYFGIGDQRALGTIENQMMGGIGMYSDSIHINLKNPASYSKLGIQAGENFGITTYSAGVSHKALRLKTYTEQQNSSVTNLDYLSIGFSVRKGWGIGFGVMPVSSVGYNLVSESNNSNGVLVTNQLNGEGGLNRVYISTGYQLINNLSLGITANFNFGTLKYRRIQSVADVQFGTLDQRNSRVNGMDFNYALNYTPSINDKYTFYSSLRVNTQANLTSKNTKEVGSFSLVTGKNIEVLDVDLDAQNLRNTDLKIPTTTTLGIGFGEERSWFLGAEYSFQGLSSFSNVFLDAENIEYKDASTIAFGGFFVPNHNSFDGYFKRITYRAGLRLDQTGMVINNKDIKNFGITFGIGLPLRNYSNLNLGFELGRRGTSASDLVEESYFKVNVGLSLNDLWFQKRKIN
ncbi:MAG: hypothetical protein MUO53_07875 [Maribacter sp.]|nr:hypothetical protein [Maribacter sp.]